MRAIKDTYKYLNKKSLTIMDGHDKWRNKD